METATNKSFMKSHNGEEKLDKTNQLNSSMTIKETPQDEYTRKIHNLGGSQ